ncbi:phytanoyl-CoA dioxygenase family protein [Cohnella herbarum]|uniref:Phytanoyl-CoA dioxygenase family protein n=1 Tax=Cohnella herbarum TaxID=2728023 RepID=A0A7Z2VPZ1_9BACL|nr:phytanoyl-CoA dioxygenase family protein [Cohnella herbarum]QJD86950.1 phytanoyl-CoA dioxygenase family protein [Cohnella herbarum]
MGISYTPKSRVRDDRYLVSVKEYTQYHRDGYLIVRGLLSNDDIDRLFDLAERTRLGTLVPQEPAPKRNVADTQGNEQGDKQGYEQGDEQADEQADEQGDPLREEFAQQTRVHMVSRLDATAEWGLLHPRVLDVTEALIGPDVYALQSMMFLNPPERGGQGWHQDSYYIKTHPDTMVGAWIALEEVDEENGCLWVVPGSNHEPIYPPDGYNGGNVHAVDAFKDLGTVANVSHLDDDVNTLSKIVANYPPPISVPMKPGDVLFFHSHLFHRSFPNRTTDRYRRSYVCHYCNARSWIPWDHDGYEGDSGNYRQILARGRTHLPYAEPIYGSEVFLSEAEDESDSVRMMGMDDGMMMPVAQKKE